MNDSFAGFEILIKWFFSSGFPIIKNVFLLFFSSALFLKRMQLSFLFYVYVIYYFALDAFMIFLLSLDFENLTLMCLHSIFFVFILIGFLKWLGYKCLCHSTIWEVLKHFFKYFHNYYFFSSSFYDFIWIHMNLCNHRVNG